MKYSLTKFEVADAKNLKNLSRSSSLLTNIKKMALMSICMKLFLRDIDLHRKQITAMKTELALSWKKIQASPNAHCKKSYWRILDSESQA